MALKSDEFYQKAIQSLARALAHLNPTPEEKVSSKTKFIINFPKFIDLSLEKNIFSSNNFFGIVLKRAQPAFSASMVALMKLSLPLAYISSKANINSRV